MQIAAGIVLGVVALGVLALGLEFAGSMLADVFSARPAARRRVPTSPALPLDRRLKWVILVMTLLFLLLSMGLYFSADGSGREDPEFRYTLLVWFVLAAFALNLARALRDHDRNLKRAVEQWERTKAA